MSLPIRTLAFGCAAFALAAASPRPSLRAQTDSSLAPPAGQAPPTSTPAPRADEPAVILMRDGTLKHHVGSIVEEGDDYVLKHRAGSVRLPRRRVARVFGSMAEVYRYKLDRLPAGDPDEHMKLARWCLSHAMSVEAGDQLRAVLAASPGDARALDMLKNIETTAENAVRRDEQVKQAGFDVPGAPGAMDRDLVAEIRGYRGPVSKPTVFDLPDALAVKRYQEFQNNVHVVLQRACASCHDENSGRNFQLIRARTDRDLRNDLLVKNNLQASLGLVDRTNPGQSPLLINAVMPHGPEKRPILGDAGTAAYRALWAWVEALKPAVAVAPAPLGAPVATAPAPVPTAEGYGGGFASGRAVTPVQPVPSDPATIPAALPPPPMDRIEAVHRDVPADADFQTVSPLLGGPNAAAVMIDGRLVRPDGTPGPAMPPLPGAGPAPTTGPTPAGQVETLPDGTQIIRQADGSRVMKLRDGTIAPLIDEKAVEAAKPSAKKPKVKIDPHVLDRFQEQMTAPKPAPRL